MKKNYTFSISVPLLTILLVILKAVEVDYQILPILIGWPIISLIIHMLISQSHSKERNQLIDDFYAERTVVINELPLHEVFKHTSYKLMPIINELSRAESLMVQDHPDLYIYDVYEERNFADDQTSTSVICRIYFFTTKYMEDNPTIPLVGNTMCLNRSKVVWERIFKQIESSPLHSDSRFNYYFPSKIFTNR